VGGQRGAKAIAKLLQDRGVHLAALLDEGGSMLEGVIPGVELPVALLGNAEKGYLSLKLWVEANPGHSSTPPEESAIGILARAIDRLEQNRLPVHLEVLVEMYRALGPTVDFSMQMALANLWLFSGIVKRKLLANPETAASIRTTTAPTLFNSGIKDNILPARLKQWSTSACSREIPLRMCVRLCGASLMIRELPLNPWKAQPGKQPL